MIQWIDVDKVKAPNAIKRGSVRYDPEKFPMDTPLTYFLEAKSLEDDCLNVEALCAVSRDLDGKRAPLPDLFLLREIAREDKFLTLGLFWVISKFGDVFGRLPLSRLKENIKLNEIFGEVQQKLSEYETALLDERNDFAATPKDAEEWWKTLAEKEKLHLCDKSRVARLSKN